MKDFVYLVSSVRGDNQSVLSVHRDEAKAIEQAKMLTLLVLEGSADRVFITKHEILDEILD